MVGRPRRSTLFPYPTLFRSQHWVSCEKRPSPGAALAAKGRNMNLAMCGSFTRDAGAGPRIFVTAFPPLKRWALIYHPCRDEFYPNTRSLSIVTPDFRNRVMNSCSNVHFL